MNYLALAAIACITLPVAAQTVPPPAAVKKNPAPAAETAVEPVVNVSAQRPTNRVDRQVYDVKSDPGATNGSAADALGNIPSVAVDPDGTVTLRGSTNVQVLIDGKPSAMLQGENRGNTLNSLPADDIESVEVINNPGAQFGNEAGGGPILNLVMRRNRKAGGFGSISANAGSSGRYNSSVSGSYNTGRLGVQGTAHVRHDGRNDVTDAARTRIDPVTGAAARTTQTTRNTGLSDSAGFNSSLTYNMGDKDTVAASVGYTERSNDRNSTNRYISFGTDDAIDRDYVRTARAGGSSKSMNWGARLDHKGDLNGVLSKLDLRVSSTANDNNNAYQNTTTVGTTNPFDARGRDASSTDTSIIDLTGDYERPVGTSFLKLGYKVASNKNTFDTRYFSIDDATLAERANPNRTNRFSLLEKNLAVYGSYAMRLDQRWGVVAGLRVERTDMDIAQQTSALKAANHYINVIPSSFVSYNASQDTDIRFSYARRIRRPGANDLNPFVVYRDEFNVSSGNPNLKPTKTDSFELGYETKWGAIDTNLRGYFRKDSGLISERKVFIGETVLLTTRDNAGTNRAGGLEFTLRGKLMPKLTLNTSGNLAYTEQRIANAGAGVDARRSAPSLGGNARLRYDLANGGQMQLSLNAQGKALSRQGYREPNATANFSVRHALTPALSLVMNVTDIFDTNKIETITDTDLLQETSVRKADGRVLYIGLNYRIGGVPPRGGAGFGRRAPER